MGIRNLRLVKHSFMTKNVLTYINASNVFWVDILIQKYGMVNFWISSAPPDCSWFFKGLCKIAYAIKPCMWLNSTNPNKVSVFHDLWCFETPLAFKPTFLAMDLDVSWFHIADFMMENSLNTQAFNNLFGGVLNSPIFSLGNINPNENNH